MKDWQSFVETHQKYTKKHAKADKKKKVGIHAIQAAAVAGERVSGDEDSSHSNDCKGKKRSRQDKKDWQAGSASSSSSSSSTSSSSDEDETSKDRKKRKKKQTKKKLKKKERKQRAKDAHQTPKSGGRPADGFESPRGKGTSTASFLETWSAGKKEKAKAEAEREAEKEKVDGPIRLAQAQANLKLDNVKLWIEMGGKNEYPDFDAWLVKYGTSIVNN
jgi:hypothetical protein